MPLVFYFSGIHAMSKRHTDEVFKQIDGHGVLLSLHGNYIRGARDWIKRICDLHDTSNVSVLFDSGAFTAWNAGEPAQEASELARIYEYAARWCDQRFRETWFITLDVLPGVPNRSPTQEEVAAAVRQSDLNHAELIRALPGRILPVFHRGESPGAAKRGSGHGSRLRVPVAAGGHAGTYQNRVVASRRGASQATQSANAIARARDHRRSDHAGGRLAQRRLDRLDPQCGDGGDLGRA